MGAPRIDQHSPDIEVARVAAAQHGAITTRQLRECGVVGEGITRRLRSGRLHRLQHGVYAVGHPRLSRRGTMHAALLGAGAGSAIARFSALELWGIRPSGEGPVDVATPRRSRGFPGARLHQTRSLPDRDVAMRGGLLVTTIARTLVDLSLVLNPAEIANVMHEAAFRRRLNVRALERVMRDHRTSNGAPITARALEMHVAGSAGTASQLEGRLVAAMFEAGAPTPALNVHAPGVAGPPVRVDALWPEAMLIVEVDGAGHALRRTRRNDHARDVRLTAAGYQVERIHGVEIDHDLPGVARRTAALIEERKTMRRAG